MLNSNIVLLIPLFYLSVQLVQVEENVECKNRRTEQISILEKLFIKYDWRVPPNGTDFIFDNETGGAAIVTFNLLIHRISEVDEARHQFTLQVYLRQQWNDARLAYEQFLPEGKHCPKYLTVPVADNPNNMLGNYKIWMPDTFIQNEIRISRNAMQTPNVLLRIYANGDILYSQRITVTLKHYMDLTRFPFDQQSLLVEISSYSYASDVLKFYWEDEDPVQLRRGVRDSLHLFEVQDVTAGYCSRRINTGEYSCLRIELILKRFRQTFVLGVYVPSIILFAVSLAPYLVKRKLISTRLILCLISILGMMLLTLISYNNFMPRRIAFNFMEIWLGTCNIFALVMSIGIVLIHWIARLRCFRIKQTIEGLPMMPITNQTDTFAEEEDYVTIDHLHIQVKTTWLSRINFVIGLIFLFAFTLFNVFYWIQVE